MAEEPSLRICKMDLFNVRSEEEFYALLAQKVIAGTSSKWDEALRNTKEFVRQLVPNIVFGNELEELKFKLTWEDADRNADYILDLAENIAKSKGIKVILCIDEFQNLSVFKEPLAFQKKLRSHWQTHQNVGYCLYGSKRHMMTELFDKASKPFYKFGDILFLQKIDEVHMLDFVQSRFRDTGKAISDDAASLIVHFTDNHPYYIQQLAQMSWIRTLDVCTENVVEDAIGELIDQSDIIFRNAMESLTIQQICYLRAVLDGHTRMTSGVMREYGISSTTSATRSKRHFVDEDVLDGASFEFLDPLFAQWLRKVYFN